MARFQRDPESLPFLHLVPNLVTILGLCAGLTSIRLVFSEHYELAAILIVVAALIDGLDGLLARKLKAASNFGAELDSLSDFLNFGVAPGLLVFQYALADARGFGWVFVLVFVICCCLRLARFNVNRDAPPLGARPHFVGVPAPAGALLAMFPVFISFEGLIEASAYPLAVALHLGLIGGLMVSRVPTISLKSLRISRDRAGWILIGAAFAVGVALTNPWLLLMFANAAYAASLLHAVVTARRRRRSP